MGNGFFGRTRGMMKSKSSSPSDLDTRHHFLLRTHFGDAFKCYVRGEWDRGIDPALCCSGTSLISNILAFFSEACSVFWCAATFSQAKDLLNCPLPAKECCRRAIKKTAVTFLQVSIAARRRYKSRRDDDGKCQEKVQRRGAMETR